MNARIATVATLSLLLSASLSLAEGTTETVQLQVWIKFGDHCRILGRI